jgi:hypothetical protein
VLNRAVRYRREVAIAAGAPAGNLAERIDAVMAGEARAVGADGWYLVGTVYDGVVDQALPVWWHPETDRARVGRPVVPEPEAVESGMPALSYNYYGRRDYRADPTYRYFLDGVEYGPDEAVRIATERDSVAGWRWRPIVAHGDAVSAERAGTK